MNKKISSSELQDHIQKWSLNQIELIRETVDEIEDDIRIDEQERLSLFMGIAQNLGEIEELLKPVGYSTNAHIIWMRDFIINYSPAGKFN